MKVSELIRQLEQLPGNATVLFNTEDWCSEGFPMWRGATAAHPCTESDGEDLTTVVVSLYDECEG